MSKHTAGPWFISDSHGHTHKIRGDDGDAAICQTSHWLPSDPLNESIANARLIAASPELLEALKDALCALEVCGRDFDHVTGKARAAIEKAEQP